MSNFSPFGSRSDLPMVGTPTKSKLVFKLIIVALAIAAVAILVVVLNKIL